MNIQTYTFNNWGVLISLWALLNTISFEFWKSFKLFSKLQDLKMMCQKQKTLYTRITPLINDIHI